MGGVPMENSLNTYSTAALAYLGDCIIELCVRQRLVKQGLASSRALNKAALEYVRAPKQAEAMKNILPILTEEENQVFHRGRNMGHSSTPKSATVTEYRSATGMEALFGWLHLLGRSERINELFRIAYRLDSANG
jgi:ribonuclease-3 family protein